MANLPCIDGLRLMLLFVNFLLFKLKNTSPLDIIYQRSETYHLATRYNRTCKKKLFKKFLFWEYPIEIFPIYPDQLKPRFHVVKPKLRSSKNL